MSKQQTVIMVPAKAVRQDLKTETNTIVYMPLATTQNPGVVKIGAGLSVDSKGLLTFDKNEIKILQIAKNGTVIEPDENKLVNIELNKTDVGLNLVDNTADIDKPVSRLQQVALDDKQNKTDTGLITLNKTVVGSINEVFGNFKNYATVKYVDDLWGKLSIGGNIALVFDTEYEFTTWLEGSFEREDGVLPKNLKIGDVILIKEENVPDYWCSSISSPMTIDNFTAYESKVNVSEINKRIDDIIHNNTYIQPNSATETLIIGSLDPSTSVHKYAVGIGASIEGVGGHSVAIGYKADAQPSPYGYGSVALGSESHSLGGVALGHLANTQFGISIGENASSGDAAIAIGFYSSARFSKSIAIGGTPMYPAQSLINGAIQIGSGANSIENTVQIYDDNIYNYDTHTLTVQNITLNGEDLADKLQNVGSAIPVIRLPKEA